MLLNMILQALLPLLFVTQAFAGPILSGTCAPVAPVIQVIAVFASSTPFCSSWLGIATKTSTLTVTSVQSTTTTITSTNTTRTFTAPASTSTASAVVVQGATQTTTITASPTTVTARPVVVTAQATTLTLTAAAVNETGTLTLTITDAPVTSTAATSVIVAETVTSTITAADFTDDSQTTTILEKPVTVTAATVTATAPTSSITLTANASSFTDGTLTLTAPEVTVTQPIRIITADPTTLTMTAEAAVVTKGTSTITVEPVTTTLQTVIVTAETSTLTLTADPASLPGGTFVQTADKSYVTLTGQAVTYTASTSVVSANAVTFTRTQKTTVTTVNFQKRQVKSGSTSSATPTLPSPLRALASVATTVISSACRCFNIPTPTITQTTTTKPVTTITRTSNVAATVTTTPVVVVTPTSTNTPRATNHENPSVVITPHETVTPTSTAYTTPTVTITPTSTFTPTVYKTPLSTSIPYTTVHTTPTVYVTPKVTSTPTILVTATAHETPLHTEHVTPTVTVTALSTHTPTVFITPLSTTVPEATAHTTPTVFITPSSTYIPTVFVTPLSTTIPKTTVFTTPTVYVTLTSTTTPLETVLITPGTTITPLQTVTPTTTITVTQTIRVSPAPVANCTSDGTVYTARDGARFIFTCQMDISGNKMPGIPISPADNFETCIDRCVNEGTNCLAARWLPSTKMCELKSGASTNRYAGSTVVYVAVRQTASQGSGTTSVLTNGDFSNGLNGWAPYGANTICGNIPWSNANGMATLYLPACQYTLYNYLRSTMILDVNATWTLSADLYITAHASATASSWECGVLFDGLGLNDPYVILAQPANGQTVKRSIASNGKMGVNGRRELSIGASCGGRGRPPLTVAIDNIKISTVGGEIGSSPTELLPTQILKNGDFSGSTLDPWVAWPYLAEGSSLELIDGTAVAQMAPINQWDDYSFFGIRQSDLPPFETGQTASVTGKVTIKYPGDLFVRCSVSFSVGSTQIWYSGLVDKYSSFTIDARTTLEYDGDEFLGYMYCESAYPYVPATPQVTFDDLKLTING